jgi:ATP-dependent helicase YprA (DUF1998 family)
VYFLIKMPESSSNKKFLFSSIEGWTLCRKILSERLPFCPHDYQLDGITAILDGKDLLAISATGSGKSGYIYMLMHTILAILERPSLCPAIEFPKNPAILVIYPTTALEEDQVSETLLVSEHKNSQDCTIRQGKKDEGIWLDSSGREQHHQVGNGCRREKYLEACRV